GLSGVVQPGGDSLGAESLSEEACDEARVGSLGARHTVEFCGLLGAKSPLAAGMMDVGTSFASSPKSLKTPVAGAVACTKCFQVCIFVNRSSGGGRAGEYLAALGSDGRCSKIQLGNGGLEADLRAFDMRDGKPGQKPGFLLLKSMCEEAESLVHVMVAGGDGTVMWAISEMVAAGVDLIKVVVGHIPFGTGNDFSRSTGWGAMPPAELIGVNWQFLRRDIRRWIFSDVVDFDLWEVDVIASGGFAFIHDGHRGLTESDKAQHGLQQLDEGRWQMKKPMVNYFSLGQCCRAGLGFEKRRTGSRLGNNLRYGYEGLKKLTLRPAPLVSDVVEELCFSTSREEVRSTNLGGQSAELLFLNVPSFAGGAYPWEWSKPASGSDELKDSCQFLGDGRLEVVSYSSGFRAGLDAANSKMWTPGRGAGRRIASAEGSRYLPCCCLRAAPSPRPFRIGFKSPQEARYRSRDGRVYFQVDGEYFVAHCPEQVMIRHWRPACLLFFFFGASDESVESLDFC
ncbi:unnamed protein product, partial [Polarella glacialis]